MRSVQTSLSKDFQELVMQENGQLKLIESARRLGLNANNEGIAKQAGFKSRKAVNYYFSSRKELFAKAGLDLRSPTERLIKAAKELPASASERQIAKKAGYASHKIIDVYFENLMDLKRRSNTLESNYAEICNRHPQVTFSGRDLSKGIRIPESITPALAEEIGWHIGDGCLTRSDQQTVYHLSGDKKEEKEFYETRVKEIFKEVYNVDVYPSKRCGDRSFGITVSSKAISSYKTDIIGLPVGKKSATIQIPKKLMLGKSEIKNAVIRGIADTDFSYTFQKKHKNRHYYPVISGTTVSKELAQQIKGLLEEINIQSRISCYLRKKTNRFEYLIRIRGPALVERWMTYIGTKNPKHETKYKIWKKFGFCPAKTTLEQRKLILNGTLNPNTLYGD